MNNDGDISGKIIRGLQVHKPIGQGKFSIVYKAENLSDNSQVALKMIRVISS